MSVVDIYISNLLITSINGVGVSYMAFSTLFLSLTNSDNLGLAVNEACQD